MSKQGRTEELIAALQQASADLTVTRDTWQQLLAAPEWAAGQTRLIVLLTDAADALTDHARIVDHLRAEATHNVLTYTARGHAAGVMFALDAVQRQAEQHLYTNTKNGNRAAMLNIVKRLRAELSYQPSRKDEA